MSKYVLKARKTTNTPNDVMNIYSRISKIKRSIKRINGLYLILCFVTICPYTAMFADWCKEISNDSTYFSVVGMLMFSYVCLLGLIYGVTIYPVIEEKEETIARLELKKKKIIRSVDKETKELLSNIKFKKMMSDIENVMED